MLDLNKKKPSGRLAPSEVARLEREIAATDEEIDGLVYELYGITDKERTIVVDVDMTSTCIEGPCKSG